MLADFVEKEKPFEHIDWDSDESHKHAAAEIKDLYNWWKNDYPNRREPIEDLPDIIWKGRPIWDRLWGPQKSKDQDFPKSYQELYEKALDKTQELEKQWLEEEQENLIRLIKIRRFLWT